MEGFKGDPYNASSWLSMRKVSAAKIMDTGFIYSSVSKYTYTPESHFYLLNPGLCTYNKKFCIGDKLADGSVVAAIYFTTSQNSLDVQNDAVLIKHAEKNVYKRYRSDMSKIKEFYEGQKNLVCLKNTIYEGELENFSENHSSKYGKLILSDNSRKCTLKMSESKYGGSSVILHAMNYSNFQEQMKKNSGSVFGTGGTFYGFDSARIRLPNNGLTIIPLYSPDGALQEFRANLNVYIATSVFKFVPPSLIQEAKLSCKKLVAHVLDDTCYEKNSGGAYSNYDFIHHLDENKGTDEWKYRYGWETIGNDK